MVNMKSQDGRKVVHFCAMTADHNRKFLRHTEKGIVGSHFLKVRVLLREKKHHVLETDLRTCDITLRSIIHDDDDSFIP